MGTAAWGCATLSGQPGDLPSPSESTTTLTSSTYHYPGDTHTFTSPTESNTSGGTHSDGTNKRPNVVAIVAGVVGGLVGLTLAGALWIFLAKQRSAGRGGGAQIEMGYNDYVGVGEQGGNPVDQPASPIVGPFGGEYSPNADAITSGGFGAADYAERIHGTSPDRAQQPSPLLHGASHGPHAAAAGSGPRHPSQVDTSDSDSGYGPGSSLFYDHQ